MPILNTDLIVRKSQGVGGVPLTNGGAMSYSLAVDAIKNNMFDDITQSERTSGVITLRKFFFTNTNILDLPLINPKVFIEAGTSGSDAVYIHAATSTDTESSLSGTERLYGSGTLSAGSIAGATTISVSVEDATNVIFVAGDSIRLSNKATVSSVGTTEYPIIAVGGVSAPVGNVITLTLTAGLTNAYAIGDKVSSIMPSTNIVATTTVPTVTSLSGLWAGTVTPHNLGGTTEIWTITFTSATSFSIIGSVSGNVGVGSITTGAAPSNVNTVSPYFTIASTSFGGIFITGDTLTFSTTAAATPFWLKRVVPTGAAVLQGNTFTIAIEGEG